MWAGGFFGCGGWLGVMVGNSRFVGVVCGCSGVNGWPGCWVVWAELGELVLDGVRVGAFGCCVHPLKGSGDLGSLEKGAYLFGCSLELFVGVFGPLLLAVLLAA